MTKELVIKNNKIQQKSESTIQFENLITDTASLRDFLFRGIGVNPGDQK